MNKNKYANAQKENYRIARMNVLILIVLKHNIIIAK